jgi:cytochrome P450
MLSRIADAFRRNPYPGYTTLRRVAPVLRLPRRGVWAVFDHESVRRALHDPAVFSSRAAPPGGAPLDWLIFLDDPRHGELRALVARAFTPRAIAALEPRITAIANDLLDQVMARGVMDLVADFAARLPVLVIAEMLGVPRTAEIAITRWSDAILHLGDTILGGQRAARAIQAYRAAAGEMRPFMDQLLAARRAEPRDDLLSRLAHATVEGTRLTDAEIFSFFQLLLLAGTETTTNLISNAMVCLLDHPAQLERLRGTPELIPAAIEEVLRFRTPVQMVFRATTRAVTLRDRTIPAGQLVLLMVGSANRDPLSFPDPARFDIGRVPVPHVGFGHGAHYCLGASLARLEARVALATLLSRTRDIRRAHRGSWRPRTGLNVHGPVSFPIRFTG